MKLIITSVVVGLVACVGFLGGFSQYPNPDLGANYGVFVGVGSAVAWAVASVCAARGHFSGNLFNLFAAVFAALSLGYLTPAEPICTAVQDSRTGLWRWSGTDIVSGLPCALRMISNAPTDWEVLHANAENIERVSTALARFEKATGSSLKSVDESHKLAEQALRDLMSTLEKRVQRQEPAAPPTK